LNLDDLPEEYPAFKGGANDTETLPFDTAILAA
jgi:hypothetical protein